MDEKLNLVFLIDKNSVISEVYSVTGLEFVNNSKFMFKNQLNKNSKMQEIFIENISSEILNLINNIDENNLFYNQSIIYFNSLQNEFKLLIDVSKVYSKFGEQNYLCTLRNDKQNQQTILPHTKYKDYSAEKIEELIKNEQSLSITLQSIGDAVIVTDIYGNITRMNPVAESLTGYKFGEAQQKHLTQIFKIVNSFTRETVENPVEKVLQTGYIVGLANHTILIDKYGEEYHISDSASPIIDKNGNIQGVILIFSDITEKYNIQQKIAENERMLSTLISNLPGMIYRCNNDKDWTMEYINGACFEITGYHAEDFIFNSKISFNDIISHEYQEQLWNEWQKALNEKQPLILEYPIVNKNGNVKWVWEQGRGIYDKDGNLQFIEGYITDITKRKMFEEALKDSEQKYRTLIENAFDCIYLFQNNKYIFVNNQFCKITGYNFEEFTSENFDYKTILSENSLHLLKNRDEAKLKGQTVPFIYELEIITKNNQKKYFEVSTVSLNNNNDDDDEITLGILRDISDRKINEELLKVAKDKAIESDKLKTAFLQNISHEIRTPLNGIIGFTELLKDSNITNEEYNEYLSVIQLSGKRLIEIVNNVLEMSKIETGQINIILNRFSINLLLKDLYNFFQPFAEAKNLKLSFYTTLQDKDSFIISDAPKLSQILTNLINNALKFTEVGKIDFGYEIENSIVRFYVKDTGIGIDSKHLNKIFTRFFQSENDDTRNYDGVGLGLAITQGLVELLGGQIWVNSEKNRGTEFYFSIPFRKKINNEITMAHNISEDLYKLKNFKILIVEDDKINYKLYERILKTETNANIIIATNGNEAVELFRINHDINLVLMDFKLPELDGFQATKKMKEIRKDIPIIAVTAFVFEDEKENVYKVGCDDYLSKPFEPNELLNIIRKVLL